MKKAMEREMSQSGPGGRTLVFTPVLFPKVAGSC